MKAEVAPIRRSRREGWGHQIPDEYADITHLMSALSMSVQESSARPAKGLALAGSVDETWPDTGGISLGEAGTVGCRRIIVVLKASLFGGPAGPGSP
jgi:hypothetical protein